MLLLPTRTTYATAVDGGHEAVPLVDLADNQPISVEVVQTEKVAEPQEELNGAPAVSNAKDMIADFVEVVGQDSGETFEKRLEDIDTALSRFDNVSGVTLGGNIEGIGEGIKAQKTPRLAESTSKSIERHAEKLAEAKENTQSRVHEENLVSVPISHSTLCDISNIVGSRKNSASSMRIVEGKMDRRHRNLKWWGKVTFGNVTRGLREKKEQLRVAEEATIRGGSFSQVQG
nr:hypothetical protein CFP56_02392 [Quercus suber]